MRRRLPNLCGQPTSMSDDFPSALTSMSSPDVVTISSPFKRENGPVRESPPRLCLYGRTYNYSSTALQLISVMWSNQTRGESTKLTPSLTIVEERKARSKLFLVADG